MVYRNGLQNTGLEALKTLPNLSGNPHPLG